MTGVLCTIDKDEGHVKTINLLRVAVSNSEELGVVARNSIRHRELTWERKAEPGDDHLGFKDGEGGAPAYPEARQTDPEEAIVGVQGQSLPTACSTAL
jgi:hypothetical protein